MEIRVKNEYELREALKSAHSCADEATIILENGVYRVNSPIVVERDNVTIKGENATLRGSVRIELDKYEKKTEKLKFRLQARVLPTSVALAEVLLRTIGVFTIFQSRSCFARAQDLSCSARVKKCLSAVTQRQAL